MDATIAAITASPVEKSNAPSEDVRAESQVVFHFELKSAAWSLDTVPLTFQGLLSDCIPSPDVTSNLMLKNLHTTRHLDKAHWAK